MRWLALILPLSGCALNERQTSDFKSDEVHIELHWDTTIDLDLHLLDNGAQLWSSGDATWCNRNPSWGAPGDADDPSLDLDDRDGNGPEVLTVPDPREGTHTIVVHFYDRGANLQCLVECPRTTATVEVYLGGTLVSTSSRELTDPGQTWTVADIEHATGTVRTVDLLGRTDHDLCESDAP